MIFLFLPFLIVGTVFTTISLKEIFPNPSETEATAETTTVDQDTEVLSAEEVNASEEKSSPDSSTRKIIKEFQQTEQKYPIITYESEYSSYKEYEDADGTRYKNMTMINPDGVMMGFRSIDEAIVASPVANPNGDEFAYYQGYHYYKGSYYSAVSEALLKYPGSESAAPYYKGIEQSKTEEVTGSEMGLYDFVYKFMPLQYPNEEKLVHVPLLHGNWAAYEETIMDGPQLLASMNFMDEHTLMMENHIVNTNEIPGLIYYELEQLDQNAYKLYLYEGFSDEEDNLIPSDEPVKRNFLIYVTSENTFELVYYNNNLKRVSITMERQ